MDLASIFLSIIGLLFATATVALLVSMGVNELRIYKLMKRTAINNINSVHGGLNKLKGKVIPIEVMTSPLGNTDCIYYKFKAQFYAKKGRRYEWITAAEESKMLSFLIDDGTGRLSIAPEKVEKDVSWELSTETVVEGELKDLPNSAVKFLKDHDVGGRNQYRLTETTLKAGTTLHILGEVEPVTNRNYQAELVAAKGKGITTTLSDLEERSLCRYKLRNGAIFLIMGVAIAGTTFAILLKKIFGRSLPH